MVHSDSSTGDMTVWATQRKILQDHGIHIDPRQHILDSICADIQSDIENQHMVIIGGDFNENVYSTKELLAPIPFGGPIHTICHGLIVPS